MKKFIAVLAVGMMIVGSMAHANTKVAEQVSVAWRTATKAQELVVKMGLGSVPEAQLAARVNQFVKSGTPMAKAYARQEAVFNSLIASGASVNEAFNAAFTVNGEVLSALNYTKFVAQTSAQTGAVAANVVNQSAVAQNACVATPASYLSGGDLAKFNQALRNTSALTGVNMLGNSNTSCANWDKDMANGFAQVVIATDKVLTQTNSRDLKGALMTAYSQLMGTDATQTTANLKQLCSNCNVCFGVAL